mmetsp:Transcript_34329/g.75658  ORF Transcript_34329/g.75658 Transcript_34329/m.75658 type:complete len:225 (+) Transcript_34329:56-730(+)
MRVCAGQLQKAQVGDGLQGPALQQPLRCGVWREGEAEKGPGNSVLPVAFLQQARDEGSCCLPEGAVCWLGHYFLPHIGDVEAAECSKGVSIRADRDLGQILRQFDQVHPLKQGARPNERARSFEPFQGPRQRDIGVLKPAVVSPLHLVHHSRQCRHEVCDAGTAHELCGQALQQSQPALTVLCTRANWVFESCGDIGEAIAHDGSEYNRQQGVALPEPQASILE